MFLEASRFGVVSHAARDDGDGRRGFFLGGCFWKGWERGGGNRRGRGLAVGQAGAQRGGVWAGVAGRWKPRVVWESQMGWAAVSPGSGWLLAGGVLGSGAGGGCFPAGGHRAESGRFTPGSQLPPP